MQNNTNHKKTKGKYVHKIEPQHCKLKNNQISLNEFIEYINPYFEKIDEKKLEIFDISEMNLQEDPDIYRDQFFHDLLYNCVIDNVQENNKRDVEERECDRKEIIFDDVKKSQVLDLYTDDEYKKIVELYKKQYEMNNARKKILRDAVQDNYLNVIYYHLIREIDMTLENQYFKKRKGKKKKKVKIEDSSVIDLLGRRKVLTEHFKDIDVLKYLKYDDTLIDENVDLSKLSSGDLKLFEKY